MVKNISNNKNYNIHVVSTNHLIVDTYLIAISSCHYRRNTHSVQRYSVVPGKLFRGKLTSLYIVYIFVSNILFLYQGIRSWSWRVRCGDHFETFHKSNQLWLPEPSVVLFIVCFVVRALYSTHTHLRVSESSVDSHSHTAVLLTVKIWFSSMFSCYLVC